MAVLVIAVVTWWFWPTSRSSPTATPAVAATTSIAQPLVAPRLSIVVLPFANLSNDPEQQYFADGITEDLTTDLSRIPHMFVISRNTAFTYRDKPVDTKQIGRELGVRYVLEGSVRQSGNQVRVNAQLIDAETDTHLWAERFDRDMGDLFALQNEITSRIAVALNAELLAAEAARPTEHSRRAGLHSSGTRGSSQAAWARQTIAEGDQLVRARAGTRSAVRRGDRAGWQMRWWAVCWIFTRAHPGAISKLAETLATQALAASPGSTLAHLAKGQLLRAEGRCDKAIPEFEMVIASNRNSSGALFALGECKLLTGSIEETIPLEEQAIRLSPRDPYVFNRYLVIGKVHLLQSRIEEAIVWLERARIGNPGSPWPSRSGSPLPMRSKARPIVPPPNLPRPAGCWGEGSFSSIAQ